MKKLISLFTGLIMLAANCPTVYADENTYPTIYTEYKEFISEYPDFYRVDDNSVYFVNRDVQAYDMSLIVSSNQESYVTDDNYGFVFIPQEDGRYIVTVEEYREEYVWIDDPVDGMTDLSTGYPEIFSYIVDVENGDISVKYDFSYSWENSEQAASQNVLRSEYFSYVNGVIPGNNYDYKSYITNVYNKYNTESYFCVNSGYSETVTDRIKISDENIAKCEGFEWVSSAIGNDDIQRLYKIKALSNGDVNVTADGKIYRLTVNNGIFGYQNYIDDVLLGDVNSDGNFNIADAVTLQEWLLNKHNVEISAEAADFNNDDIIDVFDFCLLKKYLSDFVRNNSVPVLVSVNYDTYASQEYGWYTNLSVDVIDMNGNQYTEDFGRYTGDDKDDELIAMADDIIRNGRQKYLDEKNDGLVNDIKYISENAESFKDCATAKAGAGWADYGERYLYLLYDENGERKYIELCRFGGEFAWLDNSDVERFVEKLSENGLFVEEDMLKISLSYFIEDELFH